MKLPYLTAAILFALSLGIAASAADNSGRIYGKITTVDGDEFTGLIRWDKNEASWTDLLNGTKERDRDRDRHDRRDRSKRRKYSNRSKIKFFGITVVETNNDSFSISFSSESGIRFGHISKMIVVDDNRVRLILKSGETVELADGSTDIGTSVREIIIEDEREGEIEFTWDDIDDIEFMQSNSDEPSALGERLYGTVITKRGPEFTGYIGWDVDEALTRDILDGEERGRKRRIRFDKIKAIERYSSKAATVFLKSGDEVVLRGTNDVNSSNSGILISDPNLGQIQVSWGQFERVEFSDRPERIKYSDFDGGRRLEGTLFTEDGDRYEGLIRWDDDEQYTWELLDGDYKKLKLDIEFGNIKSINKKSSRSAIITLWDGRSFQLRGSNDVDNDNKGIFVESSDGSEVVIDWDEFDRLEFTKR